MDEFKKKLHDNIGADACRRAVSFCEARFLRVSIVWWLFLFTRIGGNRPMLMKL
jgi:hypothetical protein